MLPPLRMKMAPGVKTLVVRDSPHSARNSSIVGYITGRKEILLAPIPYMNGWGMLLDESGWVRMDSLVLIEDESLRGTTDWLESTLTEP